MNLLSRLERIWYGEEEGLPPVAGPLPSLLRAASSPYRLALIGREFGYRRGLVRGGKLPVPCVSVGNIVVGGTGKTPAVSWIVRLFQEMGLRPAVVSRGYGGSFNGVGRVPPGCGAAAAARFGDEPLLLAARHPEVPVVVGKDRYAAGEAAVREHGAQVVVADDAFQHRRLARDVNIVVVDARRGFGNRRLIPGGPLREPPTALTRAEIIILNRVSASADPESRRREILRLAPRGMFVEGEVTVSGWRRFDSGGHETGEAPAGPVFAFCGLANPGVFRRSLEKVPLPVRGWRTFRDHHLYRARELEELAAESEEAGAEAVVTTEKDAVRISLWPGRLPLSVMRVDLDITRGRDLLAEMLARLVGKQGA
jgi:tetraacyldisaccharide 4'-kinase